jgi:hypothetical protein
MTEEQMRLELIKIEKEWDMCGLSDGLYADYAVELAKRAVAVQRETDAVICERYMHGDGELNEFWLHGMTAAIRGQS